MGDGLTESLAVEGGPAGRASPGKTYEFLRAEIAEGRLPAGSPLIETALASRIGVSRTPIREALRRLEQDGLVERVDRGLRVRERSPEEILEIYEVRIVLEALAARAAAERHTAVDLMRLRTIHQQMKQVADEDVDEQAQVNVAFHKRIWWATHNSALIDVLSRLTVHLGRYPYTTYGRPGRWEAALSEHADLLNAIVARDADKADSIAREHMTRARDIRLEMWEEEEAEAL